MVGERLAELRERRALTLHDLEELSGVGADSISKIENGHRKPRPSTLRKLARALGVEVEDFFREPALPLDEAPRGAGGQAQASTRTVEEFERRLAYVLEPVRAEALREHQAARRVFASEGIPQTRIGDPSEVEAGNRLVHEFSSEERPIAFGELALGYARYERENTNLQEALRRGRELLRERDEKIADLEAKLERLEQAEAEREQETAR